jgi:hypothetical protein
VSEVEGMGGALVLGSDAWTSDLQLPYSGDIFFGADLTLLLV